MTAEPGILKKLKSLPLAKFFKIVQTPPPSLEEETGVEGIKNLESRGLPPPKAYSIEGGTTTDTSIGGGYLQSDFNLKPLQERISHTQTFVRDLTLLTSTEVDALVVSASSNIGRLAML